MLVKRSAKSKTFFAMTLVAALILFGQSASANQSSETSFSPIYQVMDAALELSGVGVLRYLGFIKVYHGALYLPPEADKSQVLGDIPKRLEVLYVRPFKAQNFSPATIAGIKKNVDPETYRRLESRIAYHNGLYEDIAPGDRVSLTYFPAVGTVLEINGNEKGTIEGADFAQALFSMWLGKKPFDQSFKKALLGDK
jgi:hypothetical protein